ncbi:MAG: tetratricopeptide repeat protein [Verrucomicrobiales bacterium]
MAPSVLGIGRRRQYNQSRSYSSVSHFQRVRSFVKRTFSVYTESKKCPAPKASWDLGKKGNIQAPPLALLVFCLAWLGSIALLAPAQTAPLERASSDSSTRSGDTLVQPFLEQSNSEPEQAIGFDATLHEVIDWDVDKDLELQGDYRVEANALSSFMRALFLEEQGEAEASLKALQETLDHDPSQIQLARRVANEYLRRNDTARAIDVLIQSSTANPEDVTLPLVLATIYNRILNRPESGLPYAERARQIDPNSADAVITLAETLSAMGREQESQAVFQEATQSDSESAEFWLKLGSVRASQAMNGEGELESETLEELNGMFEKAVDLSPADPVNLLSAAQFFHASRQLERATELYQLVRGMWREDLEVRRRLASALLELARRTEAIEVLEEMVAINPLNARVYEQLGELLESEGDLDQAAHYYEQSINTDPTNPDAYTKASDTLRRLGRGERAIALLEKAARQFPGEPNILFQLGVALTVEQRHLEALTLLDGVIRVIEAETPEILVTDHYYLAASVAHQAKDWGKASYFYKRAIELDPNNGSAYNDLGYMWVELGKNLDEAGELIRRAIELEPNLGAYIDSLGWYHFKKGEYEEALVHLLRAAELPPEDRPQEVIDEYMAVIYDHIADTYDQLGQLENALSYWNKAFEHDAELKNLAHKIKDAKEKLGLEVPKRQQAAQQLPGA